MLKMNMVLVGACILYSQFRESASKLTFLTILFSLAG